MFFHEVTQSTTKMFSDRIDKILDNMHRTNTSRKLSCQS